VGQVRPIKVKTSRLLRRVLAAEVILFGVIGIVTASLAAWTLFNRLSSEFASKGAAIATSISSASNELMLTRDASTIQSLVDQFRQIRGVGYLFVVDGTGTIVSHTFVPAVPDEMRPVASRRWDESGGDAIVTQNVHLADGTDYIDVAAPILAGVAGAVHVGMNRAVIRSDIWSAIVIQILVVFGIFGVAVAVAWVVVGRMSAPLAVLTAHAHDVAEGDLETKLQADHSQIEPLTRGRDEIAELARAFLAMERAMTGYIGRLRQLASELGTNNKTLESTVATLQETLGELKTAQDQVVRQEKMASLGALTAGIAHEIKNPLNFVNNFAMLAKELAGDVKMDLERLGDIDPKIAADIQDTLEQLELNLSKIREHGVRADGIVRSMLLHSRGTSGQRQRTDINALVKDAVSLAYHGMRAQDSNFQVGMDSALDPAMAPIEAVPQDLMRALLNIANNACYAAYNRAPRPEGIGRVIVKTTDMGDGVEIRLRDTGDGIPENVRAKIFEPFFTTKPAGQGTGLGLSICHDIIVEQHKGKLAVETEKGKFTEFIIYLPRETAPAQPVHEDPHEARA
jgi:signal transduction histidine kinase